MVAVLLFVAFIAGISLGLLVANLILDVEKERETYRREHGRHIGRRY